MKKLFMMIFCFLIFCTEVSFANSVEEVLDQIRPKMQDYLYHAVPDPKEMEPKKVRLLHLIKEEINLEDYSEQSAIEYIYAKAYGSEMLNDKYATASDYDKATERIEKAKAKLEQIKHADTDAHTIGQMKQLTEEAKWLATHVQTKSHVVSALENSIIKAEDILKEKKIGKLTIRMQFKNMTTAMTNVYAEQKHSLDDQKLLYYLGQIRTLDFRQMPRMSLKNLLSLYLDTAKVYRSDPTQAEIDSLTERYRLYWETTSNRKLPVPGISNSRWIWAVLCVGLLLVGMVLYAPKPEEIKKIFWKNRK